VLKTLRHAQFSRCPVTSFRALNLLLVKLAISPIDPWKGEQTAQAGEKPVNVNNPCAAVGHAQNSKHPKARLAQCRNNVIPAMHAI